MAVLAEDMTRLRDEIETLRGTRSSFIRNLKRDVGEMKADFRKERMEMGRETRDDLKNHVLALKEEVADMKSDFLRGHAEMADTMRDHLHSFIGGLKDEVADLLSGYRDHRNEASRETKKGLLVFIANIKYSVLHMAHNVSEMMTGFQKDHADMARKGKVERKSFRSSLNQDVTDLREAFAEDISGAHKAWVGPTSAERKAQAMRRAREEAKREKAEVSAEVREEPSAAMTPKAEVREEPSAAMTPDDLMTIQGIGAGMQGRLNEAGIFTFVQLAKSNPQELRQALGKLGRMANVEEWIGQAKQLAGK